MAARQATDSPTANQLFFPEDTQKHLSTRTLPKQGSNEYQSRHCNLGRNSHFSQLVMQSWRLRIKVEASWGAVAIIALLALFSTNKLGLYGGAVSTVFIAVSLLLHEIAHLLAAVGCQVEVKAIGMNIKGAYLRRSESNDPATEMVIAVCGPIANLLVFAMFRDAGPVLDWIAQLNLVLVLANLLPVPGTDGYRFVASLGRLVKPHLGVS